MKHSGTVAIAGYLGAGNLGDEAILEAILAQLHALGRKDAVVFSENAGYTRELFPDVRVAPALPDGFRTTLAGLARGRLTQALKALARSDTLVIAGGTAVADTHLAVIRGLFWRVSLARLLGCRIILYGVGTGNLRTRVGRLLARVVFRLTDAATVREPQAVAKLSAAGVDPVRVQVSADPVINLTPACLARPAGLPETESPECSRYVGFAVPQFLHDPRRYPCVADAAAAFRKCMARLADRFVRERNLKVVFIPMQTPCDVRMAQSIRATMTQPSMLLEQRCRPGEMMALIGRLHLLVGMRLHSIIMAAARGVPWISVAYADKVTYFNELTGMSQFAESYPIWTEQTCTLDEDRFWERYLALERNYRQVRRQLRERVRRLQEAEKINAAVLAQVLSR